MEKSNTVLNGKKPNSNVHAYMKFIKGIYNEVIIKARDRSIDHTVDVVEVLRKKLCLMLEFPIKKIGIESIKRDIRTSNVSTIDKYVMVKIVK